MKICISLGTRPEIIKLAPVIREAHRRKYDFFIIHTNQHYSENMDQIFFDELKLPKPSYNLNIGSGNHGAQTGKMMTALELILIDEQPDVVLIQGDTNTVLATAIVSAKLHIPVGHIEAGLRSYDKKMPEEVNRILTDHCSQFLFTPTPLAKKILLTEGIDRKSIFVVGNTIVDSIIDHKHISKNSSILKKLKLTKKSYFLATSHRQENVDSKERFSNILFSFDLLHKKYHLPIIFPIHPRSKKMIEQFNLIVPPGVLLLEPVGYLDFLQLEQNAQLILTDSGGVQEEAYILKVPCITLRENTERPETLNGGANILTGTHAKKILKAADSHLKKKIRWGYPFGKGDSAKKILDIIEDL